ncbi:glycerate kinase [Hoyosella sp. YIM 151337]|uniref:glycerate kinase family protein n=1 Tax=Hoyosella sp. YIM 151337 TaxID=2992742 RepID=UPI002236A590|nr:glycerate kinase [Hoyosella sp. YIM 151337]MCW4355373.1 glycerate kinase [Hoyosella sp. YIM 151337]
MRVLIAPDEFGGTLSAKAAAEAIAQGWARSRPGDDIGYALQSDGGPGFIEILATSGGELQTADVAGPLGQRLEARWLLRDGVAYIESAQACGLAVLGRPPAPRTALGASSAGVGDLIAAALEHRPRRIVVGLGGSACTDGGAGLISVLGGFPAAVQRLAGVALVAATDVENPLLGADGAAAVYGPQKGADPRTVAELETRLTRWAGELSSWARRPIAGLPGSGAAGGIGAALLALGAERVSGGDIVASITQQRALIRHADLVISGEGKFDAQSLRGKVVVTVAAEAMNAGVDVVVLAGQVRIRDDEYRPRGVVAAYSVADYCGSVEAAIAQPEKHLADLAAAVASSWANG